LRDTGWHEIILPTIDPSAQRMLIQLETEYAFNPKKSKISGDDRDLGIMIREK
jgi:hypothetical protein